MEQKEGRQSGHLIRGVDEGSIAQEMGIEGGDELLTVNGQAVEDIFDYRYLCDDESLSVVIRKKNGEEWELDIEKDADEDLGIEFDSGLMDEYRSCRNRCIFCFINQMPGGMRDTLYFHDDDARLSFLQGNYITLTNMSDHDLDRIIQYRLEPINISFQTMDPQLRCRMLRNRFAGDAYAKVKKLKDAGIELNGQIVLCKGWNDGADLENSLEKFEEYMPELQSVSIVPVGLTKFRDREEKLEPFTKEDAGRVIDQIERWQSYYYGKYGTHLVHASDEWYLLAQRDLPPEENYDGYQQLENGVGMLRLLIEEVRAELEAERKVRGEEGRPSSGAAAKGREGEALPASGAAAKGRGGEALPASPERACCGKARHVTIATGRLPAGYIRMLCEEVCRLYPEIRADVVPIRNDFFGEMITVSGLITGKDLIAQLKGREIGDELLIPVNMLRSGEHTLLDDLTVEDIERTLQTKIRIVESSGRDFVQALKGIE